MLGWIIGLLWLGAALVTAIGALIAREYRWGAVPVRLVLAAATVAFLAVATVAGVIASAGPRTVVIASGLLVALLASIGGAPVVAEALDLSRVWRTASPDEEESEEDARRRALRARLSEPADKPAPMPASAVIGVVGVVERLAFILALLIGLPEVAAVVFVIKTLGQFSMTSTNRVAATRVLGSLLSIAWALLGYVAYLAVAH
ncbi:MAG: hypothetical protein Q7U41_02455 [Microbacterium sp.]|nr:hypothetical protein [Microbacterium sp.]